MLKWNNVFYYKLNSEGFYEKHKIINLVNFDSLEDNSGITPHILIYPYYANGDFSAKTSRNKSSEITSDTKTFNGIEHKHFTQFIMQANTYLLSTSTYLQDRTGAHEVGHVLGLFDIDTTENPNQSSLYHHEEILMGYSKNGYYSRQTEITYKDIAGVAITRGFHTNSDHLWLYDEDNPKDGKYKLICSLCNCVKYVDDLSSYNYYEYEQCGHNESSLPNTVDDNMIPVASYGNTDYYKCKYCRYVAPFTSRITQNYVYCGEHNDSTHILENIGGNLNYRISENHSMTVNLGGYNYKCSGCDYRSVNTFEEYSLNNYSATINKTVNLSGNETKYYKINSNYNKYYEFITEGTTDVDVKLFDENFNEIVVNDLNDSNTIEHIINQLQEGTYYLEIKNSSSSINSTSIKIVSRTTVYLSQGDNDILVNTYNNIDEYNFMNSWGAGFYKLTIGAITSNGSAISYPNETLKVYDHNNEYQEIKYNVKGCSQDAENLLGTNYLYIYFERDGDYYIHIDLPNHNYSQVILNIERVSVDEIDVASRYAEEFTELLVTSNTMTEYAVGFSIDQTAMFDITATTGEVYNGNITLVLFRKEYDSNTHVYYKTDILGDYLSIISEELILEEGTYYIGFFGNTNNVSVTVTIDRVVTTSEIADQVLIMDPSYILPYGTEVRHNGGLFGGTTITEGFTRHVHFQNVTGVPSIERQNYIFYSSNTSYATVSQFGTVFAKSVSQDREVTITAVYKYNPSIIFTIDLVIANDTSNTQRVIETLQTVCLSDFVDGKYKLVLGEYNSPYPWIQYFNWSVYVPCQEDDILVTMDHFGFLTSNGTGNVTLTGKYTINPNVTIVIHIVFK